MRTMALGPVCTDSRRLKPGDLFVPLVGETLDGHSFLPEALGRGAQAALVAETTSFNVPDGLPHWRVPDTTAAYQQLANVHRGALGATTVAPRAPRWTLARC